MERVLKLIQQSKLMYRLWRAWARVPGWRLGQLISNAAAHVNEPPRCDSDPFYVSDSALLSAVEQLSDEFKQVAGT